MRSKLRRPKLIHWVWLHIDRLDRKDGRVWALQWRDGKGQHYRRASRVGTFTEGHAVFFGVSRLQPRAVIAFPNAVVRFTRDAGQLVAVIAIAPAAADRRSIATTSRGIVVKRRARV